MIFRMITKSHSADPEIGLSTKSIQQPFGLTSSFQKRVSLILQILKSLLDVLVREQS